MKTAVHSRASLSVKGTSHCRESATLSGGRASQSVKGASHHRDGISSGGRASLSGKGAFYSSVVRKELLLSKRREESSSNRLYYTSGPICNEYPPPLQLFSGLLNCFKFWCIGRAQFFTTKVFVVEFLLCKSC